METNKELMRAEFENWMREECGADDDMLNRPYDGRYFWARTGDMWAAWQSALSQRSEAVPSILIAKVIAELIHGECLLNYFGTDDESFSSDDEEIAWLAMRVSNTAAFAAQPAPAPSAAAGEQVLQCHPDITKRIRSIVDLLCLQSDMPEDDLTGYEWAVLGIVRSEIARLKAAAQPRPAQGDAVPVADLKKTDLSKRLRKIAESWTDFTFSPVSQNDLRAACEEIDRYYSGMMNWKSCAEAKDANATRQSSADAGDAARAVVTAWDECNGFPDTNMEISAIGDAVDALRAAIAAQGGKGGA